MAKKINLNEKNPQELTELLTQKREELRTVRFSSVGARVKDSNDPKNVRKDIARIMTELTKRAKTAPEATA